MKKLVSLNMHFIIETLHYLSPSTPFFHPLPTLPLSQTHLCKAMCNVFRCAHIPILFLFSSSKSTASASPSTLSIDRRKSAADCSLNSTFL